VAFIQVIEVRTKNVDEIMKMDGEWEAATEGKRTLRKAIVGRDRNDPERYFIFAFFDDYESAIVNSNLPETAEFAAKQAELAETVQFIDLDVIDER
jgi:hypothetical protein